MDATVLKAMARWPNVPAVYGWVRLTVRGEWLIDGSPVVNSVIKEFICRNYLSDEHGRWFFQNGPQRVFVDLDCAPLVYRAWIDAASEPRLETHCGRAAENPRECWLDESGNLLLVTELGIGCVEGGSLASLEPLLHGALDDSSLVLAWRERSMPVQAIGADDLPARFGFDRRPRELLAGESSKSGAPG